MEKRGIYNVITDQAEGIDDPNAYAGRSDQILVMMMGMEVDLPLPHQKTLQQQEEGIGGQVCLCTAGTSWATRSSGTTRPSR